MTVTGALSSFHVLGEMSPHQRASRQLKREHVKEIGLKRRVERVRDARGTPHGLAYDF